MGPAPVDDDPVPLERMNSRSPPDDPAPLRRMNSRKADAKQRFNDLRNYLNPRANGGLPVGPYQKKGDKVLEVEEEEEEVRPSQEENPQPDENEEPHAVNE